MQERQASGALDKAALGLSRVAMLLSGAIVAIITYEVVARYVFFRPTLWAYELAWWLAGILYLLAGVYVMQQRAHIRITIFYDKLPRGAQRACDVLSWLFLFCFCFAVVWGGFNEAQAKLMRWEGLGSAWNPPIPATLKPLILLTLTAITAQGLSNLIKDWNTPPESFIDSHDSNNDNNANENESDSPPRA